MLMLATDRLPCMQVRQQVAEGLASTRCGVAGIRSSLLHSPDMLQKGLQLLLVVLRLSTVTCEAAIGSSFPQAGSGRCYCRDIPNAACYRHSLWYFLIRQEA